MHTIALLRSSIIINSVEFIYCACGCLKTRSRYDIRGRERKFIKGHHNSLSEYNPRLKGKKNEREYILITKKDHPKRRKNGYVLEHRLVYETYYNCCLLDYADIHHINGNKSDNRIENLAPTHHNNHHSSYHFIDMSDRICLLCDSKKTHCQSYSTRPCWYKYKNGFICKICYERLRRNKIK